MRYYDQRLIPLYLKYKVPKDIIGEITDWLNIMELKEVKPKYRWCLREIKQLRYNTGRDPDLYESETSLVGASSMNVGQALLFIIPHDVRRREGKYMATHTYYGGYVLTVNFREHAFDFESYEYHLYHYYQRDCPFCHLRAGIVPYRKHIFTKPFMIQLDKYFNIQRQKYPDVILSTPFYLSYYDMEYKKLLRGRKLRGKGT